MPNIWISMFSYVENPFLRFLRLVEEFLTSYEATQPKKRRKFMYDFKKGLKSLFVVPKNGQYTDFDVFLCSKSVFEVPEIA